MALSPFNKRLLEFIYFLVKNQKLMNSFEISKALEVGEKRVVDRSVRRWLSYLKKQDFWYCPSLRCEALGLRQVFVSVEGLKNLSVIDIVPYRTHIMPGTDLKNLSKAYVLIYWVPAEHVNNFRKFWELAKRRGLISHYDILETKSMTILYAPLHKYLAEDGKFIGDERQQNDSYFIDLLEKNILQSSDTEISSLVFKRPLIVPTAFEYSKGFSSARSAWLEMKRKLGKNIWTYIEKEGTLRKKTDGVGIDRVYKTMKFLQQNFDQFFTQMRVDYIPLYSGENIAAYVILSLNEKNKLAEFVEKILGHSILLAVFPPTLSSGRAYIFYITAAPRQFEKIVGEIIPAYATNSSGNKIIWRNYGASRKLWAESNAILGNYLKENYSKVFDQINKCWRYDAAEYIKKLKVK